MPPRIPQFSLTLGLLSLLTICLVAAPPIAASPAHDGTKNADSTSAEQRIEIRVKVDGDDVQIEGLENGKKIELENIGGSIKALLKRLPESSNVAADVEAIFIGDEDGNVSKGPSNIARILKGLPVKLSGNVNVELAEILGGHPTDDDANKNHNVKIHKVIKIRDDASHHEADDEDDLHTQSKHGNVNVWVTKLGEGSDDDDEAIHKHQIHKIMRSVGDDDASDGKHGQIKVWVQAVDEGSDDDDEAIHKHQIHKIMRSLGDDDASDGKRGQVKFWIGNQLDKDDAKKMLHLKLAKDGKQPSMKWFSKGGNEFKFDAKGGNELIFMSDTSPKFMLGVALEPIGDLVRSQLNLDDNVGIAVESVIDDSPAAEAGLQKYDVIVKVNDADVRELGDLTGPVAAAGESRSSVKLVLIRAGEKQVVQVTPKSTEEAKPSSVHVQQGNRESGSEMKDLKKELQDLRMAVEELRKSIKE